MADFAFHFKSVKRSTPYTLTFEGSCTNSGVRNLIIKYPGTEVINETSIAIPQDILEQLKEEFNGQFGYGPFNTREVKKAFENKKDFYLNYKRNND
ncbi:hypothetical protein [Clostridium hydrogeniformans]|uniref:hypothetical protein n=1 Tax=Clostridium hydrogeniformans TaxID=349933 RepID=UPI0004832999|nr:hypothetical protein [Clostridium hydrogeniformans]